MSGGGGGGGVGGACARAASFVWANAAASPLFALKVLAGVCVAVACLGFLLTATAKLERRNFFPKVN